MLHHCSVPLHFSALEGMTSYQSVTEERERASQNDFRKVLRIGKQATLVVAGTETALKPPS